MFLAQFLSGVGFSFVFPFFPFYFRTLGVETEKDNLIWMGWSSAAFGITMAFAAPFWGLVADRYGRKLMVIRSMLGGSIVLGLMGLATSPWHILVLRILQGITTGTVSASITLISSVTPPTNLGISMGILQTGLLLGNSFGPFFGGLISDRYGFRIPCGLASIMLFIGTIIVILGATEKFIPPRSNGNGGFNSIKEILSMRGFKVLLSVYFFVYVLFQMIVPILPLFIEQLSGNPSKASSLTGIFVSVTGLLAGITSAVIGRFSDRFGHTRILIISLVSAGIISIPQSFAHNLTVLFIERCLLGIAIGGVMPSVNALVSNTIPRDKVGGAYGLTSSVTCLGIGAGPLIGGYLASLSGLRVPFSAMGILAFFVAFLLYKTLKVKNT